MLLHSGVARISQQGGISRGLGGASRGWELPDRRLGGLGVEPQCWAIFAIFQ